MSTRPTAPSPDASPARLCRWVLGLALRRRLSLLAVGATTLLKVGVDALKPWPMLFLVDYVLQAKVRPAWAQTWAEFLPGAESPANLIAWCVAATVMLFFLSWALGLVLSYASVSLGQRMVYDLATDLFAHLQKLSLRFHAKQSTGDNIRRVTADAACVSMIFKDALLPLATALASLLVMCGVLWRVEPGLTLLALAVVPWMAVVLRRYAKPMLDLGYQQQQVEMRLYQLTEQTFSSLPVVQAFCREELNDQALARANRDTIDATLALTRVQLRFKILMGLATAAGTAAILWFGTQQALAGHLSIGVILLFLSYLGAFYEPLASVMYTGLVVESAAGSAKRVLEVFHTPHEVNDPPGAKALGRARGEVRFENVTFGYEPERAVLRGISFQAQPGECVALAGATGAGKTTLASLIPRFFDPWEGRVELDGQDVRNLTLRSLRTNVAMVLQEPFLFPLSVAENIAYGRPRATQAEIEAAARAARAHDFIASLPKGYRTVLGDRGATLSLGQRQRLAIARALLKDAPILILDEPTSALDADTEHELLAALETLMSHRTTFIIAHRLSTLRRTTRILFLKDGGVAEAGSHEELLARGGLYARFWQGS
ncbi:MAG: ABC transporter ATP-binding protein [Verrucomicrobia bacterium]|nr:ABC transporter ATP-binding protein [Verrucomicrobiota bacterium]